MSKHVTVPDRNNTVLTYNCMPLACTTTRFNWRVSSVGCFRNQRLWLRITSTARARLSTVPSAVTVGCVSSLGLGEEIQSGHSVSDTESRECRLTASRFMNLAQITILTYFNNNAVGRNVWTLWKEPSIKPVPSQWLHQSTSDQHRCLKWSFGRFSLSRDLKMCLWCGSSQAPADFQWNAFRLSHQLSGCTTHY